MWNLEKVKKICPGGCVVALLVAGKIQHHEVHACMSPHFQHLNLYCLLIWERIL